MSTRVPSKTGRNWLGRILLSAGGLLVGAGIWLLLSDSAVQDFERASKLPHHLASELRAVPAGTSLLVEGQLVPLAAPGPHGFIAYRREQFLRKKTSGASSGQEEWLSLGSVTPQVALQQGADVVEVTNNDYILKNWPHSWRSDIIPHYRSVVDASERIFGFKAGDRVTVDGRLVGRTATGRPELRITALASGGPERYLQELRGGVMALKIVGAVLVGFGLILLIVVMLWRRAVRRRAASHLQA
jgi:hypothetical protein